MTIEVVLFLQDLQNGFFDLLFNFISFLGEEYVYIFVLGTIYYAVDKKLGEYLAFSLFFSASLNNVLKGVVQSPRPFEESTEVINMRPDTATGHSFPSGHTQQFSTILYAASFYLKKRLFFVISTILVILMMLSRMYLGVHYLEDVAVSMVLGLGSAYAIFKVFLKLPDFSRRLRYFYLPVMIFFLPFLFFLNEEDFFKGYGLFVGFIIAMILEKTYVNFTNDVSLAKKVIRVIVGLVLMLVVQIGLKAVFGTFASEGTRLLLYMHFIRYFFISFIGLGVFPYFFKHLHL